MDKGVAVILTAMVGGVIALQPAINAGLGERTGNLPAALISFIVGTLVLAAIVLVSGQISGVSATFDVSWYYLLGGALGALFVASSLVLVREIGAGALVAALITGQLTASIVIDRVGFLGLSEQPITASRLAGVGLLLAGTYLIVR